METCVGGTLHINVVFGIWIKNSKMSKYTKQGWHLSAFICLLKI